jgi:hypothetical protein
MAPPGRKTAVGGAIGVPKYEVKNEVDVHQH